MITVAARLIVAAAAVAIEARHRRSQGLPADHPNVVSPAEYTHEETLAILAIPGMTDAVTSFLKVIEDNAAKLDAFIELRPPTGRDPRV